VNILSLFDGMSCGMIAAERAGLKVDKYYASEIDKYASQASQANYPDIIRLGDVTGWRDWSIDWASIDLLIGGSPCQGFSFAGKQLAFDDPRSKLFFVYVDILNHIRSANPDVKFLLENVKMKKEHLAVISKQLGVEPVFINSSLVSAQNRQRYYWANWEIKQPADLGIALSDIIETNPNNTTFMSDKFKARNAHILRDDLTGKAKSLSAMEYAKNGRQRDYINPAAMVVRKLDEHGKARCVSTVAKDSLVSNLPAGRYPLSKPLRIGDIGRDSQGYRIYSEMGKSPCILCNPAGGNKPIYFGSLNSYRKLTPIECERLQTVPDNYTAHVSNTQRYKMLGNGWTVDVIAHIFNCMK